MMRAIVSNESKMIARSIKYLPILPTINAKATIKKNFKYILANNLTNLIIVSVVTSNPHKIRPTSDSLRHILSRMHHGRKGM